MRRRYSICAALLGLCLALAPTVASASDLVVAVAPTAAPPPPPPPDEAPERVSQRKQRESVAFGASLYAMSGTATDEFEVMAFMARPALELFVSIDLGEVSLVLGGTTLAIEVFAYENRTSVNYPALITMGIHHDRWLAELAGGASIFTEDSEGPFELRQDQEQIPSPRAEARAGFRFLEFLELRGFVGAERRIASHSSYEDHSDADKDSLTRFFTGVSFGIGAN